MSFHYTGLKSDFCVVGGSLQNASINLQDNYKQKLGHLSSITYKLSRGTITYFFLLHLHCVFIMTCLNKTNYLH